MSKCYPFSHSVNGEFGLVLAMTFGDTYSLLKREKKKLYLKYSYLGLQTDMCSGSEENIPQGFSCLISAFVGITH